MSLIGCIIKMVHKKLIIVSLPAGDNFQKGVTLPQACLHKRLLGELASLAATEPIFCVNVLRSISEMCKCTMIIQHVKK